MASNLSTSSECDDDIGQDHVNKYRSFLHESSLYHTSTCSIMFTLLFFHEISNGLSNDDEVLGHHLPFKIQASRPYQSHGAMPRTLQCSNERGPGSETCTSLTLQTNMALCITGHYPYWKEKQNMSCHVKTLQAA